MIPPLAIIQARVHSSRLPYKMLRPVGGHPLIWWAWSAACRVFDDNNVVVACPAPDVDRLQQVLPDATLFGWEGDENDVLGRLHACAHRNRTDPTAIIWRITPDDYPIDPFREGCTLAELDELQATVRGVASREHVGTLFKQRIEVNTEADLRELRARV